MNFRQLIHCELVLNWLLSIKETNMGNRNLVVTINIAVVLFVHISRISAQGQSSPSRIFSLFWIILSYFLRCDMNKLWNKSLFQKKKWKSLAIAFQTVNASFMLISMRLAFFFEKSRHNKYRENMVDIPNRFCQLLDLEYVLA